MNIGVHPHNVLTMRLNLPRATYKAAPAQKQFFDQLIARIDHLPRVESASVSTVMALEGGWNGYVSVPGVTNPKLMNLLVEDNYITPEYFKTFGMPLIEGRNFNEEDMQQVVATGEKIATLYQSAKDPSKVKVPRRPVLSGDYQRNDGEAVLAGSGSDRQIIHGGGWRAGANCHRGGGRRKATANSKAGRAGKLCSAAAGARSPGIWRSSISVKSKIAPAGVLNEIREVVRSLDNTIAVYHVRTMEDVIAENMQDATLQTLLLGTFAALALILATVGLYGVMSYLVTQRTHEIGIRMALGARHEDVLRMVILQGAKLILLGVIIGTAGALALTRLLSASLWRDGNGYDNLRCRYSVAGDCGTRGVLHSGAARDARRSHGRPAPRMTFAERS